ncbi:AAA family ATPase [Paenibacillus oleatilyticus]|uniref:Nuclease SbcCD subunit C n=1 Tax=Paenibacillus oleatilyticus TaxID=2594886 RepID=A0ABV4UXD6_9BACL
MIPLRLIISNFRAIEHADIDLSAVTLAAIAGRNGVGKSSAFTLAPRFALFGDVVDGVSLDDLVRRGTTEMSVTFEFEHQGSVYRAIRTRSTKGKGKSTLELQQRVGSQWESRSAEKIVDTESVIRNLLNLDDETFTASSMILQGQANAFTGATAGKRKEILSQILGLNVYEELQERARQRAASLNIEIEKAKDRMLTLNERLTALPVKEDDLRMAEDQHCVTLEMIAKDEASIKTLEARINDLKIKSERIGLINRDLGTLDDEIASLERERSEQSGRLERAEKILANEATIKTKTAELEQIKQRLAKLEARQPEVERLRRDLAETEADLFRLDEDMLKTSNHILILHQQLAGRETLRQRASEYEQESGRLLSFENKADQWNLLAAELRTIDTQRDREEARLRLEEQRICDKISELMQQEAHIHDSGCLPTCKFQQAAATAVAELPELRRRLAELDRSEFHLLAAVIAEKQVEQQVIGYDPEAHRTCKGRVEELRQAANAYAQLSGKDELYQQLEQQHLDQQVRKTSGEVRRNDLQQQLNDLEAALAPLPDLMSQASDLQRWAKLMDEIGAAREAKQNAEERIVSIGQEIITKRIRWEELDKERTGLVLETLEYDSLQRELKLSQYALQESRRQLAVLAEQIGGIKAVLAALDADRQERERLAAEIEPKALRWTRYQTLIKAFGRDGIPALIIENAVPQLERIANEILGQMSKGKHYVRFETQRELKSRDGVAETLDIMIGDWTAERPYETFSGGEQLRIDYAIRFALAELLAQRAGSKVEWLTIDEGLGSQDAEHRTLVLESIKAVAGRFRRVLVITHIEDALSAFDQVVRFENTDGGIEIHVA